MVPRRDFLKLVTALGVAGVTLPSCIALSQQTNEAETGDINPKSLRFILDLVHDNPGETPFVTKFKNTAFLKSWGYTGQCPKFFLQTAINYDKFDPTLLPPESEIRAWSEKTAADIDMHLKEAKDNGMPLYPFTDVLVVPKSLMEKYGTHMREGNRLSILKPVTEMVVRQQINAIFDRFPELGGITIRFGETYLQDTPHHVGSSPVSSIEEHQALIALLRDEVCVKRSKIVFYRTWSWGGIQLHTNPDSYLKVTNAIEPHENLIFSIKHAASDFLRGYPFNPTLGIGKHSQLVEVSCMQAGVYGKNAHPYYIGQGVIDGWEEMGKQKKGLKDLVGTSQFSGVWTWTRGDGWAGPYITNEFWVNLNAWVISHFGQDPALTEPELFDRYAQTQLKLSKEDTAKLRELSLLATSATFHGQLSSFFTVSPWWCRDQYLTALDLTKVVENNIAKAVLEEKAAAVADWKQIEELSRDILLANANDREFLQVSSTYGRIKFAIIEQIWTMQILAAQAEKYGKKDVAAMKQALSTYDALWLEWQELRVQHECCPTLYVDDNAVNCGPPLKPVLDQYRRWS